MRPRTNLTGRVGLWSGRHPWRAIGIWLAFIVIAVVAGGAVGTNKLHDGDQAVGEAGRAQHTIAGAFEQHADEQVLLHSSKTTVSEDPQYQAAIRDVVARVQGTELALDVRSPLDERYRNQVSADGHSALVPSRSPARWTTPRRPFPQCSRLCRRRPRLTRATT